jgi:hypothetical protein
MLSRLTEKKANIQNVMSLISLIKSNISLHKIIFMYKKIQQFYFLFNSQNQMIAVYIQLYRSPSTHTKKKGSQHIK